LIPRPFVTAWRAKAPWPLDAQVEQDLVLSRALLSVFEHATLPRALAFRGGTDTSWISVAARTSPMGCSRWPRPARGRTTSEAVAGRHGMTRNTTWWTRPAWSWVTCDHRGVFDAPLPRQGRRSRIAIESAMEYAISVAES
jgi:hypothetical protein